MKDKIPLRPPPDLLEEETIERGYYCHDHKVVKVIDKLGRSVCPVCIVEDWEDNG